MISVNPDPAHPRGGFAELTLAEDQVAGDQTQVAIFDNYSERYLGEAGWQPTKVLFGPYAVTRQGGQARLVIGPEIVNQIEEYANVKVIVENTSQDVSWPDEIVPAPGAAKIGGIMSTAIKEEVVTGTLSAKMPEPEPEPEPEKPSIAQEVVERPAEVETPPPPVEEKKGGKAGMLIGLLVMVLLAAGLAYYFLNQDTGPNEPIAEPVDPPVVAPPPPVVADNSCGVDALRELDGFDAQASALRECGASATADAALGLVERAAALGDGDALLLFGTIYDGSANDPTIEDQIGLTFGDVPATAAEYYARAIAAGSQEATDRLNSLCERMAGMSDTLIEAAVTDYCGQ